MKQRNKITHLLLHMTVLVRFIFLQLNLLDSRMTLKQRWENTFLFMFEFHDFSQVVTLTSEVQKGGSGQEKSQPKPSFGG